MTISHGIAASVTSRIRSLLNRGNERSESDDNREQLYFFTTDLFPVTDNVPSRRPFSAFAIYSPLSKHNWISKNFAEKTLQIFTFEAIPSENVEDEIKRAIGQLQICWLSLGLSRYQQRGIFYVAPHAKVDVIFGHTSICDKQISLKKALRNGTARVYKSETSQILPGTRAESEDCSSEQVMDLVSFEEGIATGVLMPVDADIDSDEDKALRPSIADLKEYNEISQALADESLTTDNERMTRSAAGESDSSAALQRKEYPKAENLTLLDADVKHTFQNVDKSTALKTKRDDDVEELRKKRRRSGLPDPSTVQAMMPDIINTDDDDLSTGTDGKMLEVSGLEASSSPIQRDANAIKDVGRRKSARRVSNDQTIPPRRRRVAKILATRPQSLEAGAVNSSVCPHSSSPHRRFSATQRGEQYSNCTSSNTSLSICSPCLQGQISDRYDPMTEATQNYVYDFWEDTPSPFSRSQSLSATSASWQYQDYTNDVGVDTRARAMSIPRAVMEAEEGQTLNSLSSAGEDVPAVIERPAEHIRTSSSATNKSISSGISTAGKEISSP